MLRVKARWLKTRTYFNDSPPPPPVPPTVPPPPPPPQTFTQEQVNAFLKKEKDKDRAERESLITQLETLKTSNGLTQQEKDDLQLRIDGLTSQHQTETERLKGALDKEKKESKEKTETLTGQVTHWQGQYHQLLVRNAINVGAVEHKAASADQLTAMLLPQAKVVEVIGEDGKATGVYEARLPMSVMDKKTNKASVVDLPIVEAIGKMREDPKNANLFLVDGKPGFGGNNMGGGGGAGGKTAFDPNMSPSDYRKKRKEMMS